MVNTALKMGHKAISTENVYTHPTEEGLRSVITPSQAILDDYKKTPGEVEKSAEDRIAELEAQIMELKKQISESKT